MDRLTGKVAIVTGAASGFGRGIAERFAQEGCAVIVNDISRDAGEAVAAAIRASGSRAQFAHGDVTRSTDVKSLLDAALASFGRLDIVPHFRQAGGGCFINIASTAGVRPRPGLTWYNGTKGAVIITSKGMAAELGPDNIRVNCVNPVIGETALLEDFMGMPDTPENRKKFLATIPMGRFSRPADVANACLFFASDEAAFITGTCMEVDGGRCV